MILEYSIIKVVGWHSSSVQHGKQPGAICSRHMQTMPPLSATGRGHELCSLQGRDTKRSYIKNSAGSFTV